MSHQPLIQPRSLRRASARPASAAPHVYIETFGCQMNEYDTELVRALLMKEGFGLTEHDDEADVVLLNTCAIRENAHNRVYGHLGHLKSRKERQGVVIGVLGCMAQNLKKELLERRPYIDVLVGPDSYRHLPRLLTQALRSNTQSMAVDLSDYETYEQVLPDRAGGVNAWIAVMRGCDNFCTFCVVPYTRGRERSRDPRGVVEEAQGLVARGYRQITLLGQNVNSYRYEQWDFARLVTEIADLPGVDRVRFMSPHPKDFPPSLLDAVAQHPNICRQIHLPVQSGNDRVLAAMGRSYTHVEYRRLVEDIRARGDIALSTDIICGFCGETDAEYRDTYRLLEDMQYHSSYIFHYSERKNTIAARKFPDDVPNAVKRERVAELMELQRAASLRIHRAMIGTAVDVLVEGDAKKSEDQWTGHTECLTTVVWDKVLHECRPGDVISILVDDASASTLYGRPVACAVSATTS